MIFEPRKVERGFLFLFLLSFGLLAFGIFLGVGLLQAGVSPDGEGKGFLASRVLWISGTLGFAPALYLSLLSLVWGAIAFVTGRVSGPLRRLGASLLFVLCLSMFLGLVGGDGGAFGKRIAVRLSWVLGDALGGFLLAAMTLVGLLLSTDWFFYRSFSRMVRPLPLHPGQETGVGPEEEAFLAAPPAAEERIRAEAVFGGAGKGEGASVTTEGGEAEDLPPARRLEPKPVEESSPGAGGSGRARRRRWVGRDLLLETLLEDARRKLAAKVEEEQPPPDSGAEEAEDPFAGLEDEDLLERAGKALDRMWEDDPKSFAKAGEPDPEEPGPLDAEDEAEGAAKSEAASRPVSPSFRRPREERASLFGIGSEDRRGEEVEEPSGEEPSGEEPVEEDGEKVVEISSMPPRGLPVPARRQEALFPEDPAPEPEQLDLAARVVLTARRPTISLLQRRMGIGYADARQILETLQRLGVVDEPRGSGTWDPLIPLSEWEERRR